MPSCQKCNSERILVFCAKAGDTCSAEFNGEEYEGYVLEGVGIDDGEDYVYLKLCLECGQLQGEWPKPDPKWDGLDKIRPDWTGAEKLVKGD